MIPDSIQDYPLTKNSTALMIGGWVGAHGKYYADNYDCHVHIFEPQVKKVKEMKDAFKDYPKVKIYDFGLGVESGEFRLSRMGTDGCSFIPFIPTGVEGEDIFEGPHGIGHLIEVGEFLGTKNIQKVDLALINCEGYEYKLLPHLIKTGLVSKFKYLMVQFHPRYEGAELLPEIRKMMAKTHFIRDDYEPQWIVWQIKGKKQTKRKGKKSG